MLLAFVEPVITVVAVTFLVIFFVAPNTAADFTTTVRFDCFTTSLRLSSAATTAVSFSSRASTVL